MYYKKGLPSPEALSPEYNLVKLLQTEMRESLVGFCHPVGIVFFLH